MRECCSCGVQSICKTFDPVCPHGRILSDHFCVSSSTQAGPGSRNGCHPCPFSRRYAERHSEQCHGGHARARRRPCVRGRKHHSHVTASPGLQIGRAHV